MTERRTARSLPAGRRTEAPRRTSTGGLARHVAFLRGVMPTNCRMPDLRAAFEAAGFTDVRTVLASGNVVFDARGSRSAIVRDAEAAMQAHLGRTFEVFLRPVSVLREMLDADPFMQHRLPTGAKRVVTFLHVPHTGDLPPALGDARILSVDGCEAFTTYVPGSKGPEFMTLITRAFGAHVTTRTWETVRKCVDA